MTATMQIRRLTQNDGADYRALRLRAFQEHPEAFTSAYEEEVLKPLAYTEQRLGSASAASYWGAFAADLQTGQQVLVGIVGLEREQRLKNRHKAVVIGMYVAPEQARRGVGRALLAALLTAARASELEQVVLTVTQGNASAEQLYRDAGFTSYGMEPRAIKVGTQYFGKNLMYLSLV